MADLQICPGPVGMLTTCEHGYQVKHYFLQGPCNRCGRMVTISSERYTTQVEVREFRCRECMQAS